MVAACYHFSLVSSSMFHYGYTQKSLYAVEMVHVVERVKLVRFLLAFFVLFQNVVDMILPSQRGCTLEDNASTSSVKQVHEIVISMDTIFSSVLHYF